MESELSWQYVFYILNNGLMLAVLLIGIAAIILGVIFFIGFVGHKLFDWIENGF